MHRGSSFPFISIMSHQHAAVVEFEASEEYQLAKSTGGRKGLVDVDAILARDSPEIERPTASTPRRLHGVNWYAQKGIWMVRHCGPCGARGRRCARSRGTAAGAAGHVAAAFLASAALASPLMLPAVRTLCVRCYAAASVRLLSLHDPPPHCLPLRSFRARWRRHSALTAASLAARPSLPLARVPTARASFITLFSYPLARGPRVSVSLSVSRCVQARSTANKQEFVFECNSARTAGLVYDAVTLNTRGPAGVASLNHPEALPDSVFIKLGITRRERTDGMARYLLRLQLEQEGLPLDATTFSPPPKPAEAAAAAAAALAAPDGSAFTPGGPGPEGGLASFDPLLTLAQEAAIMRVGLERSRARIARLAAQGRHSFIEVEVKVRARPPV